MYLVQKSYSEFYSLNSQNFIFVFCNYIIFTKAHMLLAILDFPRWAPDISKRAELGLGALRF